MSLRTVGKYFIDNFSTAVGGAGAMESYRSFREGDDITGKVFLAVSITMLFTGYTAFRRRFEAADNLSASRTSSEHD